MIQADLENQCFWNSRLLTKCGQRMKENGLALPRATMQMCSQKFCLHFVRLAFRTRDNILRDGCFHGWQYNSLASTKTNSRGVANWEETRQLKCQTRNVAFPTARKMLRLINSWSVRHFPWPFNVFLESVQQLKDCPEWRDPLHWMRCCLFLADSDRLVLLHSGISFYFTWFIECFCIIAQTQRHFDFACWNWVCCTDWDCGSDSHLLRAWTAGNVGSNLSAVLHWTETRTATNEH